MTTAARRPTDIRPDTTDQDKKQSKEQVANEDLLQPVVISGFVSSLQNSIVIQKNSDSIVEAVSAQEIGQLPGTSIADALGRLPGVSAADTSTAARSRSAFTASAPTSTSLRSTAASSRAPRTTATSSSISTRRAGSAPSKCTLTPSADIVNQGIAGTIDMLTMKPLDQKGPVLTLNANYQTIEPHEVMPGPGVSANGHDIDGIVGDEFFDHTLGVYFGVDLEANPYHILHQAPWGYATDCERQPASSAARRTTTSPTC